MSARELVVLGTASQVPTRYGNHNGYLLRWDGEGFLFDPGEGTQRQMIYADVAARSVTRVCITHFHGDHFDHVVERDLDHDTPIITEPSSASRLRRAGFHHTIGVRRWGSVVVRRGEEWLRVTAMPAEHGPPVVRRVLPSVMGSMLEFGTGREPARFRMYITGDTVWYDGVAEVARRFPAGIVLLFAGAARTRGPFNLTMDTNDAIETAHAFPRATIVPVHCEGWAHFTQSGEDLAEAFKAPGLGSRLRLLERGIPTAIEPR